MIARNRKRQHSTRKLHLENMEPRNLLTTMLATVDFLADEGFAVAATKELSAWTAESVVPGPVLSRSTTPSGTPSGITSEADTSSPTPTRDVTLGRALENPSDEARQRVVEFMESLGVSSLDDLGTIEITASNSDSFAVGSGVFMLQPNALVSQGAAFPDSLRDVGSWSAETTTWTGRFESRFVDAITPTAEMASSATVPVPRVCFANPSTAVPATLADRTPDASGLTIAATNRLHLADSPLGTVIQYTGNQTSDTAVILADKVILDAATITLSNSITQLVIVANSIESRNASEIRWQYAATQADPLRALKPAATESTYDPHDEGEAPGADGGDGDHGQDGAAGNDGLSAPDVFIYVREFLEDATSHVGSYLSFPTFDLRGQDGGDGQDGQDGGDGGDGAQGLHALSKLYECKRGAGYGGHGGNGGDGGKAGHGGNGGDGGSIEINFVQWPDQTYGLRAANAGQLAAYLAGDLLVDGGAVGAAGERGAGGLGGQGGDPGEPDCPWCREEPTRRGVDGVPGSDGGPVKGGAAGTAGAVTLRQITVAEWETAFTAPYIVSATETSVHVGEVVVFQTANITGEASLTYTDDLDSSITADHETLTPLGANQYAWRVPESLTASQFTVTICREDDQQVSNDYRIEVLPVIAGVYFADEYDARPGGTAYLLGTGLRDDGELYYDGAYVETVSAGVDGSQPIDGYDWLEFRIPVAATHDEYFVRTSANEEHTVYLDQVYPLADSDPAVLELKKTTGLTFRPSQDGYAFSNGAMAAGAKAWIDSSSFGDIWTAFTETYGAGEVTLMGGMTSPLVWINFLAWYGWWSTGQSATCLGLSTSVLEQYFSGVTGSSATSLEDVRYTTMLTQSHVLSDEVLTGVLFQTLVDAISPTAATVATVNEIVNFFDNGGPGGDAPVIMMVPELSTYTAAIAGLTAVQSEVLALIEDTLNIFDGTTAAEAWDSLTAAWDAAAGAITDLVTMISRTHALAPYMAVYAEASDTVPSRLYFYDSNGPDFANLSVDGLYMELGEDADGNLSFNYDMADDGRGYVYGTSDGWLLASAKVDYLLAQPDLLFDGDGALEVILHALTH